MIVPTGGMFAATAAASTPLWLTEKVGSKWSVECHQRSLE